MKKLALILLLLTLNFACTRQPKISIAPEHKLPYVTDNANVLDDQTESRLEARLAQLHQHDNIDFAVVTVNTTAGQPIFDQSLKLASERSAAMNENRKGGLFLLVATDDRQWRIQTTRSIEARLPNQLLQDMSAPMTELFQKKQYGEGITKYVDAIIAKLGEAPAQ